MPELDGCCSERYVKTITATIPFIFLTAQTTQMSFARATPGANGYLTKPFTTAELLEAIATISE